MTLLERCAPPLGLRFAVICLALATAVAGGAPAAAFEVSPIRVDLNAGAGATTTISIRNSSETPMPIEAFATRRVLTIDGQQSFQPADEDWLLFPPQVIVPAGETRALRAQYLGDPTVAQTQAYVVNIAQVPVEPVEGAQISVVFQFGVAVYVNPPGGVADLEVNSAAVEGEDLVVNVTNTGARYGILSQFELEADGGGGSLSLAGQALAERTDNPLILPGDTRVFRIREAAQIGGGAVTARFSPLQ